MKNLIWTMFSGVIALTDLFLKKKSEDNGRTEDKKILKEKILLRNVHNHGFAMNLFQKYPKLVKTGSAAALAAVGVSQIITPDNKENIIFKAGLSLVLGGALSNVYDRLKRGYVVDYIAFNVKNKKMKNITYNIGDFSIFGGTFLLIVNMLKK